MGARADDRGGAAAGGRRATLRRSVGQIAAVLVAVVVVAAAAGWLFARGDAGGAARTLLREDVEAEPVAEDALGPDPALPTSGPQRGEPRCGIHRGPLPPARQVATLAAGGVIVHHRADLDDGLVAELRAVAAEHEPVLVRAADRLPAPVVATAWGHRLEQPRPDVDQLELFLTGWVGRGPDPRPCPSR